MDTKAEFLNLDLELELGTDEIEATAQGLQEQLTAYDQRKLAIQRSSRLAIENLELEQAELQHKHAEAMKRIDASIAAMRERSAAELATVARLAAATRAALEALQP